jgi:hypothetical protein
MATMTATEFYFRSGSIFQMTKLKDVPLDGCERNIINENGSDTIGNVLCDRINRFLPGIDRITDVTVHNGSSRVARFFVVKNTKMGEGNTSKDHKTTKCTKISNCCKIFQIHSN